jgi:hypothetical protein
MSSSSASLDLSFIKSLFGSSNVAPTNSKPSPQSNNIPVDPQQQQIHGMQQSPLVEQQPSDLADRNKATVSRVARSPPSSSQQPQVETGTLETTVTGPSKTLTQHCPLTPSAAVPPPAPHTTFSAQAPSPTPFAHQLPPCYPSTSQSSDSRVLSQNQQKAKRKEGRRQRLQRTKQKQKMNQYNGKVNREKETLMDWINANELWYALSFLDVPG